MAPPSMEVMIIATPVQATIIVTVRRQSVAVTTVMVQDDAAHVTATIHIGSAMSAQRRNTVQTVQMVHVDGATAQVRDDNNNPKVLDIIQ